MHLSARHRHPLLAATQPALFSSTTEMWPSSAPRLNRGVGWYPSVHLGNHSHRVVGGAGESHPVAQGRLRLFHSVIETCALGGHAAIPARMNPSFHGLVPPLVDAFAADHLRIPIRAHRSVRIPVWCIAVVRLKCEDGCVAGILGRRCTSPMSASWARCHRWVSRRQLPSFR